MSNHIISMAYKRDLRTAMRKSVMILLADKASDDGSGIYASKQTMADELCCSKQTVIDTIKGFVTEGLLEETGQRRNVNGFTVEYGIVVAALEAVPLVGCHAARQSNSQTGQPAEPVKETKGTGQPAGPKPSKNPQVKHTDCARALPDDWKPALFGPKTKSREVVDGWPPGELESQVEHFVAHHRSKGSKFKDWQDAWSTWVLTSRRFGVRKNGNDRQGSTNTNRGRDGFLNACFEAADGQAGHSFARDG